MGLISKSAKQGGGTDVNDTETAVVDDVNLDMNVIFTEINGEIDDANIDGSADITLTKLGDHASSNAVFLSTGTSPGDTASPTKPTDASLEFETLRYRIAANQSYTNGLFYTNTGGTVTATDGWLEPPIVGRNLLPNPGFEDGNHTTDTAPDGWTLINSPDVDIEAAAYPAAGADKRSLNIVATGTADEGILATVTGLKASTKYLIGMAYTLTTGEINLDTTGTLSSGDYQHLALNSATDSAGTTVAYRQGIVKTDSTPTDVVVRILSTQATDDFNLIYVWMYELSDDAPIEAPHIPMQTATYTTADDDQQNVGAGAWETKTDLSLAQYVPHEGYRFFYEVTLCFTSDTPSSSAGHSYFAFRIQQNIDGGGATTVEGPLSWRVTSGGATTNQIGGVVNLKYIIENPTPGASYAFTVDSWVEGTGSTINTITFNPTVNTGITTQSSAKLYTERI